MNHRWLAIGSVVLFVAGCMPSGIVPATTGPVGSPVSGTATPSGSSVPTIASPSRSTVVGIIPWSSETPAPPSAPTTTPIADAAPCRTDQIAAGNAGWGGATGSLLGGFLVWNTSGSACLLRGVPTLAIFDASGQQLRVTPSSAPSPLEQGIVLRPGRSAPAPNEDPPSGLASETFQWFNWCGPAPEGPLSLAVTLPSGGSAILPIVFAGGDTSAPRCDDPAAPSTMSVSAFEETPGPSPTEPPPVPAEGLTLTLEVPGQATAGETLHYIAALTNPSADAIALRPCPAYRQSLVTPSGQISADYLLDCRAVPSIGPGEIRRFAMEFAIPAAQEPTTAAALIWELDPYDSQGFLPRGPAQKVSLGIVAP